MRASLWRPLDDAAVGVHGTARLHGRQVVPVRLLTKPPGIEHDHSASNRRIASLNHLPSCRTIVQEALHDAPRL